MSTIDSDQVRHVAHLARLKLSDAEVEGFAREMGAILDYMRTLESVATEGVEPTAHAMPVMNVLREDVARESLGAERALANAPDADPPYFRVPKVLDQESA